MGSRTRTTIVAAVLLVVASACLPQWGAARYDSGNSGNNVSETVLSRATIGSVGQEWQVSLAAGDSFASTPVIAADTMIVAVTRSDSSGLLAAYSASGQGCSGSPRTCTPRWTATSPGRFVQPVVAGGVVYTLAGGLLRAYDAAGVQGCDGSPTVCQPLWSGTTSASGLSVEGTRIVATDLPNKRMAVYSTDATGCTGSPRQCAPTLTWDLTPNCMNSGAPPFSHYTCGTRAFVVKDARIYVTYDIVAVPCSPTFGCSTPVETGGVLAFDATVVGPPLWPGTSSSDILSPPKGTPAVADGFIFYGMQLGYSNNDVSDDAVMTLGLDGSQRHWQESTPLVGMAIDATSVFTTSNAEVVQTTADSTASGDRVRTFTDGLDPTGATRPATPPALANGLLYQGWGHVLNVFDATGATGCDTATPAVCSPIRSIDFGNDVQQVIVSNARIFVETADGRLISLVGGKV